VTVAGACTSIGCWRSTAALKGLISVRLDQDVLAKLREAGPGWDGRWSNRPNDRSKAI
jgi:uncharacterized protein (DUF4415 family)